MKSTATLFHADARRVTLKRSVLAAILLMVCQNWAGAALLGRASLTAGGADYQAYYDTVLDITWAADANLAGSTVYGPFGFSGKSGVLNPGQFADFLAVLNGGTGYLGGTNWRLPFVVDVGDPGCPGNVDPARFGGSDCFWNVLTTDGSTVYSEFASLYYDTLGNEAPYLPDGSANPDCPGGGACRKNSAPFANIQSNGVYWSGTPFAPITGYFWFFNFASGQQNAANPGDAGIWVVHDGDFAAVPAPPAFYLLATGMGILVARDRRRKGRARSMQMRTLCPAET